MRVLVLGGAGYLGAHMVRLLQSQGDEPIVFDNFSSGRQSAVGGCPVIEGDLLDTMTLMECFEHHRPDLVMHFAACGDAPSSLREPDTCYRNNLAGTMNLLGAMHQFGLRRLIFSSSAAVYGAPDAEPIDETAATVPLSPYGRAQLSTEEMIADYASAYGMRALCLRGFTVAGADAAGDVGPATAAGTQLVPRVLQAAIAPAGELQLFGGEFPTRDGFAVRDFIHVSDLCQAHRLACDHLERMPPGSSERLNLGSGMGHSALEVLRRAEQLLDREIPYDTATARAGDAASLVADSSRARELLGWESSRSSLDNILVTAWAWLQNAAARRASSAT